MLIRDASYTLNIQTFELIGNDLWLAIVVHSGLLR